MFNAQDRESILRLSLSSRNVQDNWYWFPSHNGAFSVRSCYRLISGDCKSEAHPVWHKIWKLKILEKMRNFLWRCARECIPTRYALSSKRVFVADSCPLCHSYSESISHILFECPVAVDCWSFIGLNLNIDVRNDIRKLLSDCLSNLSANDAAYFATVCYELWCNRNAKVWRGSIITASQIVNSAGRKLS